MATAIESTVDTAVLKREEARLADALVIATELLTADPFDPSLTAGELCNRIGARLTAVQRKLTSTIEGLTTDEVDTLKVAYQQESVLTLDIVHSFYDGTDRITQAQLDEFLCQITGGERCKVDGKHFTESPIN